MAKTDETKQAVIKAFRRDEKDTGSPEVQVALLTSRIKHLTEHLKLFKKDHSTRRGLLQLVSRRMHLLKFLARTKRQCYLDTIAALGLRR